MRYPCSTYSGHLLDLGNVQPSDIRPVDLAVSLARQPRWGGHTRRVIPVGQHVVLSSRRAWDQTGDRLFAAAALLHDAEEAYTGDIKTPIKDMFPEIREWCTSIRRVIFERFEVPWPLDERVKQIDREMLATEAEQWVAGDRATEPEILGCDPGLALDDRIEPWTPGMARVAFISQGRYLGLWE